MSIYGDPIDPRRVFCSSPYIEFVHFLRSPYIWAQNGPDEDPQGRNVVSRIKRSPYMGIKWTQTENSIYVDPG